MGGRTGISGTCGGHLEGSGGEAVGISNLVIEILKSIIFLTLGIIRKGY
jgi:hypothetical protein